MNPIFQVVSNSDVQALNNAIIQGQKINTLDEVSGLNVLEYAILTLKYSMVKTILVFVNLLLPSEKSVMLNSGLKTLIKCIDKFSSGDQRSLDLSEEYAVFDQLKLAGADLNLIIDETNGGPIGLYHYAIKLNSQHIFDNLISSNVSLGNQDNSVILYAFLYNRVSFISTLIQKSSVENLQVVEPYSKKSLAHYAIEQNEFAILQMLIDKNPSDFTLMSVDDNGKSLLHYIVERYTKDVAGQYIDYLLSKLNTEQKSEFLNIKDIMGNTALHYAIQQHASHKGCGCLIKRLVDAGTSLYIKNSRGTMPIEMYGLDKDLISSLC